MSQRRSAADCTVTRPWSGMRRDIRVVTHKRSRSDLHETMIDHDSRASFHLFICTSVVPVYLMGSTDPGPGGGPVQQCLLDSMCTQCALQIPVLSTSGKRGK
jgi:hypothetical protein